MVAVVKPHGTHLSREREASLYCAYNVFLTMQIARAMCISSNANRVLEPIVLHVYSWQSTLYVDFMEASHDNFTRRLFSNLRGAYLPT